MIVVNFALISSYDSRCASRFWPNLSLGTIMVVAVTDQVVQISLLESVGEECHDIEAETTIG